MCADVDECATGSHQCGDEGNCVDFEGGYSCLPSPVHTTNTNIQLTATITPTTSWSIAGTNSEIEPTTTVAVEYSINYGTATSVNIVIIHCPCSAALYDIVPNYWLPILQVQVLPL